MSIQSVNKSTGDTSRIAGGTLWADSPIGTILAYGGATAPSGWFLCQGQELTKTEYAELYAVIGDSFGTASVNTKFVLPDLREATTKGVGLTGKSNNHYDSDGVALGEFVNDQLQNIGLDTGVTSGQANLMGMGNTSVGSKPLSTFASSGARLGATTEVKAVGVNYIIKAKQVALPADLESAVEDAVEEMCTDTVTSGSTAPITSGGVFSNVLLNSTPLATNTNLNNCIETSHVHVWCSGSTTLISSLSNKPSNIVGGECAVIYIPMGGATYGQQFYIDSGATNWGIYTRHKSSDGWSGWTKLHSTT